MATIEVKGTATRIFYENKGVEVVEFFKTRDGEMAQRKFTAWFDKPVNFDLNASGVFSGLLSAVIEDWKNPDGSVKMDREGKPGRSVKISINGATFTPDADSPRRQVLDVPASWSEIDKDLPF